MKAIQQLCAAVALTLVLFLPAFAGDILLPGGTVAGDIGFPGATVAGDMQTPGATADPVMEIALGILLNVSSLF